MAYKKSSIVCSQNTLSVIDSFSFSLDVQDHFTVVICSDVLVLFVFILCLFVTVCFGRNFSVPRKAGNFLSS